MTQYPQVLVNARISNENKNKYMEIKELATNLANLIQEKLS